MMKARSSKNTLLPFVSAMGALVICSGSSPAAEMSASLTPPLITGADIGNYGTVTGNEKWWAEGGSGAGSTKGQTFTTGSVGVLLKGITYQVPSEHNAEPEKTYALRVGTVSGTVFTEIHSETATQDCALNGGEYMTWEFETPVMLEADTIYAIDVGMTGSTSGWGTGIPYINVTGNEYAGGDRYSSGDGNGVTNNEARLWGVDPMDNSAVSPILTPPDASGTFSYTRRDTLLSGVIYEIWTSTDLENWTKDAGAGQNPGTPVDEIQTVVVSLSATPTNGKLFVQVRAIE